MKCGLSATIDLDYMRKLEDITITRRAKLSPVVNEIIGLGLDKYDELEFTEDLKSVKREETLRNRVLAAKPEVDL